MLAGQPLIVTVVVVGFSVLLLASFIAMPWALSAEKRRQWKRAQSSLLGPFDEIWHPAAHRSRLIVEVQAERVEPAPSPGDQPLRDGTIVIRRPRNS